MLTTPIMRASLTRNTRLIIMLIASVLAVGLILATVPSTGAFAGVGSGGSNLDGNGDTGGGGGSGGSGGGGSGGGGGGQPGPPVPSNIIVRYGGPSKDRAALPAPTTVVCAGGDAFYGWAWKSTYYLTGGQIVFSKADIWCYKPAFRDVVMRCGWSVSAYGQGPSLSTSTISSAPRQVFPTRLTPFATGDHSMAACTQSYKAVFSLNVAAPGHWALGTQGTQSGCSWRLFQDHGVTPDRFLGCSSPYPLPTRQFRATTTCRGTTIGEWTSGVSFNLDDCRADKGGDWSCTPAYITDYDGGQYHVTGYAPETQVGHRVQATWGPMAVQGLSNARAATTHVWVDKSTRPYNPDRDANGHMQPLMLTLNRAETNDMGTNISSSGDVASLSADYLQASSDNHPISRINREVRFVADKSIKTATITGFDFLTGQFQTTTEWRTESMQASCQSEPLTVNVLRARIANEGQQNLGTPTFRLPAYP